MREIPFIDAEGGGEALAAARHRRHHLEPFRPDAAKQRRLAGRFDMGAECRERHRLVVDLDLAELGQPVDEGAQPELLAIGRGIHLAGGFTSLEELMVACRLRAYSMAPAMPMAGPCVANSLTASTAGRGALAMRSQMSSTALPSAPLATTSLTSPISRARRASIIAVE